MTSKNMEDDLKKMKMEDDLNFCLKNQNDDPKKMDLKKYNKMEEKPHITKNGRQPKKIEWKMNQSTKINLIGCDAIVNSPSLVFLSVFS
jgi:ribosomal protein L22